MHEVRPYSLSRADYNCAPPDMCGAYVLECGLELRECEGERVGIGGKVLKGKTERPACASSAGEINYLRNRGNWSYQHLGISSPGVRAYVCVCEREGGAICA